MVTLFVVSKVGGCLDHLQLGGMTCFLVWHNFGPIFGHGDSFKRPLLQARHSFVHDFIYSMARFQIQYDTVLAMVSGMALF